MCICVCLCVCAEVHITCVCVSVWGCVQVCVGRVGSGVNWRCLWRCLCVSVCGVCECVCGVCVCLCVCRGGRVYGIGGLRNHQLISLALSSIICQAVQKL